MPGNSLPCGLTLALKVTGDKPTAWLSGNGTTSQRETENPSMAWLMYGSPSVAKSRTETASVRVPFFALNGPKRTRAIF